MKIAQDRNGDKLTIFVAGRLDTTTAPELDDVVKASLPGIKSLTFDFADLQYISSSGLRVLLSAAKARQNGHNSR